ncbi:MGDG synthase family glycosyltransferase [Paenibacillus sp. YN15]|uniref:MGDG synthase family glycosyltransferase n=1 Tax=Paenibacillus sp. YN15 TaxID=1742774 RepID=UPI000DCCA4F7|nr:glycosyltransferase [Paenibacillus sp. YN15]RAU96560.1 galactosyldiacylglycerol synthase [Paenibacillus sp. YN15]
MRYSPGRTPSILVLTGNLGDGHRQAAHAVAEAAEALYPGARIRVVDVMEGAHPLLCRLAQWGYMLWITRLPWLYGFLFRRTQRDNLLSRCLNRLPLCSARRLARLVEETHPAVIVSTFPSASAAVARLKARGRIKAMTVTVMTDHTSHSYWLHAATDRYIVGSEHVRRLLLQWPIPDRKIAVTGIPIRPAFRAAYDRQAIRTELGLKPELPTVMIMGGGGGLIGGDWARLLQDPGLLALPLQVVIVCGRNEKLKDKLAREMKGYPHPVLLTGYVNNIPELMAASDLLITKPGGLTSSEALASGLPMLLYKPLPGQEYDNAAYLTGIGAALQAKGPEEFTAQLARLLTDPGLLAQMKASARLYSRQDSAEGAVREILEAAFGVSPEKVPVGKRIFAAKA